MLAPLKDRSLIEREPTLSADERIAQLEAANAALSSALRQSRQAQRRNATLAARNIVAQANEIERLETLYWTAHQRVTVLESGQAIIELGRRLMALSEANEQLIDAASRVWTLDRTLCAAREECARMAHDRDLAINRLDKDSGCPLKPSP
ncbi:hypothetical protein [Dechloromonas sp. A34]|uniref:hypothetical protein n=1 Tax=Dechloromonas sp. A34 TaxID=447588 RepID=UPI002249504D|nr:hypothetical protein [Dechloromonas sp. A34]